MDLGIWAFQTANQTEHISVIEGAKVGLFVMTTVGESSLPCLQRL